MRWERATHGEQRCQGADLWLAAGKGLAEGGQDQLIGELE